jgi:diguanylate cyclase (GGDEF)-like protein
MTAQGQPVLPGTPGEIAGLIQTLVDTGQRLEDLTAGQVDTVADPSGRTFLLRHAQDQLRLTEAAKQAAILNALPAHIALLDNQGVITSVNDAWRKFADDNALVNKAWGMGLNYLSVCDAAQGDDAATAGEVAEGIRAVLAGQARSYVTEYPCHSPTAERWFLLMVMPMAMEHLGGAVVMHLDITVRYQAQARLQYLGYYDVLTGLANRKLFMERVAQFVRSAAQEGSRLGLVLIDIERFKSINDSLGRSAGDALLVQVGAWLTKAVGDASFVARLDADHFAAVLPKFFNQPGGVGRMLEQSIAAFGNHAFTLNGAAYRVAAKAGIALYPEDGVHADALFKNAEAALKEAKATGDRYLFYDRQMTASVASELNLENRLRLALKRGEFVMHYQPKLCLPTGKLASAEALIRWNDPQNGLMPPASFIPLLESTGMIQEVGHWALTTTLADYLRWHAAGLPVVRIAVNVSALQLRDAGFGAEVTRLVGLNPLSPEGLELEITESVIMQDLEHTIASLREIRAQGVRIAIDDFGTGYSSLSYLSRLPIDTLKIDRAFVTAMTDGPQGMALVTAIITLAHSLKLTVVAEGVETQQQSDLLLGLGCDEIQGFLYSKPLPADVFEAQFLRPHG